MGEPNQFNEDYYERGVQLGISGYSDYRWLPDLTIPMSQNIIQYLNIKKDHTILDFGCAKGYTVKALNDLGYNCYGTDISEYAISCAPASIKDKLVLFDKEHKLLQSLHFDFVIAKDVFEHIKPEDLEEILTILSSISSTIFCVIPLGEKGKYVVPEYESDVTHIVREDMGWWRGFFQKNGLEVRSSVYRVPGVKDNWSHYKKGNGFFILRVENL